MDRLMSKCLDPQAAADGEGSDAEVITALKLGDE